MQAQLAALVPPGFLRDAPASVLAEYPRYLKALATRAQRALNDPSRDQQRMLELRPFADALADAAIAGRAGDPEWQALRWADRKRVGQGKGVSVRLELWGR